MNNKINFIYPLTIVRDRYCGSYSGANFWHLTLSH